MLVEYYRVLIEYPMALFPALEQTLEERFGLESSESGAGFGAREVGYELGAEEREQAEALVCLANELGATSAVILPNGHHEGSEEQVEYFRSQAVALLLAEGFNVAEIYEFAAALEENVEETLREEYTNAYTPEELENALCEYWHGHTRETLLAHWAELNGEEGE